MKVGVNAELMSTLNELFSIVLHSGVTRLRGTSRLSSLLVYEEEHDLKRRQKYENIVEEMKNVSCSTMLLLRELLHGL